MTKEERKDIAMDLRRRGYNCSQSVVMAFRDLTGLDEETSANATTGFGGGVGGQGEVCGVVSAFAFVAGFAGEKGPEGKAAVYKDVRALTDAFRAKYGKILCRELKGSGCAVSCNDLICGGIDILHDYYCGNE